MRSARNVVWGISWDDTKLGSPFRGPALAVSWDDTKRKQMLGAALAVLSVLFLINVPPASIPGGGPSSSVIVRLQPGAGSGPSRFVQTVGGQVGQRLEIIDGFAASLPSGAVSALSALPGVASVTVDHAISLHSGSYDPASDPGSMQNAALAVGAPALWQQGITGRGVDIAMVDSGIAPVPGLNGSGKVVYGPDFSFDAFNPSTRNLDAFGHGTFMAGIIAGNSSDFSGLAPESRLVSVKAANAQGVSDVVQVIAGIGWVVAHRHDNGLNIRVLNLSFGTESPQSYQVDPLAYAAEVAWRNGIVVVVSAGNNGATGGLTDPANDPYVLAVGADATNGTATLLDDAVAAFSSVGNGVRNPDLIAPGAHIQSLRVPGSFIDQQFAATGRINDRFFRGSGTSEAAAMASGSVALMLQKRPELTPNQVKALLTSTARPLAGVAVNAQGHGLEWVAAAAVAEVPAGSDQSYAPARGSGSLELARAGHHTAVNGQDVQASPDSDGNSSTGSSWTGSSWTGSSWTGSSWTGSSWTGSSWTGSSWTGSSWTGSSWTGSSWTGVSWTGVSWTGCSWTGVSWTGSSWTGSSWT